MSASDCYNTQGDSNEIQNTTVQRVGNIRIEDRHCCGIKRYINAFERPKHHDTKGITIQKLEYGMICQLQTVLPNTQGDAIELQNTTVQSVGNKSQQSVTMYMIEDRNRCGKERYINA